MKKILSLSFLLLILNGCVLPSTNNRYELFYINDYSSTGQALHGVIRYLPQSQKEITIKELIEAQLNYGVSDDVKSPFPSGTAVLWGELQENGLAAVGFTSEYGELSGIEKTIADFAVFHTIIQLPDVYAVQIHFQGQEEPPPILKEGDGTFLQ